MGRHRGTSWLRTRVGAVVGASLLVAAVLPATTAGGAVPRPTTWSMQTTPNRQQVSNRLAGVACASAVQCVAVGAFRGYTLPGPTPVGTLIETFNGTKWSTTASPGQSTISQLFGVSCPTSTRCYAVGQSGRTGHALIATSDGGPWTAMPAPPVDDTSQLSGISCADATHCVAVGWSIAGLVTPVGRSLVMTLSGATWSVTSTPSYTGASLSGVSCRSATLCVAVGSRPMKPSGFRTLALQLTGGSWTVMTTANRGSIGSQLADVVCTSGARCTAVGFSTVPGGDPIMLAESWANGTWTLMSTPTQGLADSALVAIDCSDATHCIAVGRAHTTPLIEKLSGSTWTRMTTPSLGSGSYLADVDCPGSSTCFAVGSRLVAGGIDNQRTLVLRSS